MQIPAPITRQFTASTREKTENPQVRGEIPKRDIVVPTTDSNIRQEYNKLEPSTPRSNTIGSPVEDLLKSSGADWSEMYAELKNAITVRHYSKATLKTYTGWVRKFQAFTKSKDAGLLLESTNQTR